MRQVHEQEGGSIRTSGVPSAGDRQATKSGIVVVLRIAPWSVRVKRGGGSIRAPGVPSTSD